MADLTTEEIAELRRKHGGQFPMVGRWVGIPRELNDALPALLDMAERCAHYEKAMAMATKWIEDHKEEA